MAVENNNETLTEEDKIEETVVEQPDGLPPEVMVEGEEEVEERPQDDFNANLAEAMDERTLKDMARELADEYKKDKLSRKEWEEAYIKGLDLLGTRYQEVTKPFKGASGVTHPLLAESVTQFQAQAYKELVPSDGPVRTQVIGLQTPQTEQQAERVKDYMNYLLMEEMEDYTTDMDQMLFYLPLSGSTFKKIYYDVLLDRPVSKYSRIEYFVHYKFLPGLGFYGFGLTHMIGGLSLAATQSLRQLIDAGTLKNLPAGFKSRGIRVRDDDQPIQPGEFRDVDAPGGNIRDQFFNLPFTEPSVTLYNLLGFVVQAGQKFAAITDSNIGNDVQNRAVGTTVALMERGSRVMSGVHKRCYYAMRLEFKILARICGESLPPEYPYDVYGGPRTIKAQDFDNRVDILPVADPNIMSMSQRVTLAQTQLQIASSNPQMHNLHEAYRRVYEALGTKQIEAILKPPPKQPEPLDPAKENARSLQMQLLTAFEFQDHDAHLQAHMAFMQSRMVQINPQVYALLQSHISDHISFKAKNEVKQMVMQNPEMAQMAQQDPQQFEIMFEAEVARVAARITQELVQSEMASQNKEDPLIKLKQQEIDLRAMDLQRKVEETKFRADQDNQRAAQRLEYDYDKLAQQDSQSDERLEIARDKIRQK
jgi:hypothetical protein